MKNPTIATLLNIIPGLGYLYVGRRVAFGVMILISNIVAIIASSLNPSLQEYYAADLNFWDWLGLLGLFLIIIAFMYDGYHDAVMKNSLRSSKLKKK